MERNTLIAGSKHAKVLQSGETQRHIDCSSLTSFKSRRLCAFASKLSSEKGRGLQTHLDAKTNATEKGVENAEATFSAQEIVCAIRPIN